MQITEFSRKLDTTGRLVIPIRLREAMGLEIGQEYSFYTHEENGKKYLCIECPVTQKLEEAKALLKKYGYKVEE